MNSFRVCKRCRCLRGASDSCCSQHSSTTATTTTTTTTTTATTTTTTKSRVTSNCGSRGEHVEGTRATHVLDPHPDPDLNLGRPSVITKKKNDAGRISRSNNITVVMSESRGRPVHHHKRPDRLGGGGKTRREAKGGDNNERSSATAAAAAAALVVPGGAKEAACNSAEERELSDTVFQSPLSSSTPAGRAEVTTKYGRAYSQPEDPGQLRLEKMRLEMGGESEESHDVGGGGMIRRHTHTTGTKRRNRSLYGVSPHCKFGPKGYLNSTSACSLTIPDPSNQRLNWTKPPLSVLIIRKHLDESVLSPFRDLVVWLVEEKQMLVYVEQSVLEEPQLAGDADFAQVQDRLTPFTEGVDDLTDKVDFIICLGGDGTLLYASSLFQGSVPPVMAFNMGSLGFLTPFQFYEDFKMEVNRVMKGSASLLLRYRLKCVVVRHDPNHDDENIPHVKNIQKEHGSLKTHKLVLNEVVVDRGPSSYLSNLDLYIEGRRVTSVQGDGLIISTPTGSTAYAVAAGASMIHPSVPCILLTPICPHSLSFRPIVVPAGVEIKVMLSPEARGTAMVSFDGRDRQEMHQGDSLRITTAAYPVPSICAVDQIEDWFDGLAVCLNWNIRRQQRPLMSTSSLTSIDSADSDAMTSSQHSQLNGQSDKSSSRSLTGGNGS